MGILYKLCSLIPSVRQYREVTERIQQLNEELRLSILKTNELRQRYIVSLAEYQWAHDELAKEYAKRNSSLVV